MQKYLKLSKRKQKKTSGHATKRSYEKRAWHRRHTRTCMISVVITIADLRLCQPCNRDDRTRRQVTSPCLPAICWRRAPGGVPLLLGALSSLGCARWRRHGRRRWGSWDEVSWASGARVTAVVRPCCPTTRCPTALGPSRNSGWSPSARNVSLAATLSRKPRPSARPAPCSWRTLTGGWQSEASLAPCTPCFRRQLQSYRTPRQRSSSTRPSVRHRWHWRQIRKFIY